MKEQKALVVQGEALGGGGELDWPGVAKGDWMVGCLSGLSPKRSPHGYIPPLGLKNLLINCRSVNRQTAAIQDLILGECARLACITKT